MKMRDNLKDFKDIVKESNKSNRNIDFLNSLLFIVPGIVCIGGIISIIKIA